MSLHFLSPAITAQGELLSVAFDERYDTTAEDLWTAVTDPERLARWFEPIEGDLTVGGRFTIGFSDDNRPTMTVLACDAPRSYAFEWVETWGATRVTVEVVPDGDRARLRLTHEGLKRSEAAGYGAGWETYFHALWTWLAGKPAERWTEVYDQLRPEYDRRMA